MAGREATGPIVAGELGKLLTAGGGMNPLVGSLVESWARAGAETTAAATSASDAMPARLR
jgi:hypothetical protein